MITDQLSQSEILLLTRDPKIITLIQSALTHDALSIITADEQSNSPPLLGLIAPQLILIDTIADGEAAVRTLVALRAQQELRSVPVLMLVAAEDLELRSSVFDHGATDCITVPFDEREVRARISVYRRLYGEIERNAAAHESVSFITERLKLLLKATGTGVWDWDINSNTVIWSDNIDDVMGDIAQAFDGTYASYMQLIHPDDRDYVQRCIRRAMRDPRYDYLVEHRCKLEGVPEIWLEGKGIVIRDENGEPIRMLGTVVNITYRKHSDEMLARAMQMHAALNLVQTMWIDTIDLRSRFEEMLQTVLDITESEYGFIGEVHTQPDGQIYLKTHALSNIAWDDTTRAFYDRYAPEGLEFIQLESLYGQPMKTGQLYISNSPDTDPHRYGLPPGHPALKSFMGIPLYSSQQMIGLIGIANRPGGYEQNLADWLEPFCTTCATLIVAARNEIKRSKAEQALRQSQQRLQTVLANAPLVLFAIDLEGVVTMVSGHGLDVLHRGADDFEGKTISQIFVNYPHVMTHIQKALMGEPTKIIIHLQHTIFDTFFSPIRGEDGTPGGVIGLAVDITEREQAQVALRRSEERYRIISEMTSDYAYSWPVNPDGTLGSEAEWITDSYSRITGYDKSEVLPTGLFGLYHPDDLQKVEHDIGLVVEGYTVSNEYRVFTKEGTIRHLRIYRYPVWDDDHIRVIRFYGVAQDLTEQKYAEEALRQSEERYRMLAANLPGSAVILLDRHMRFVLVEGPEVERTGFSRGMLEGRKIGDVLPSDFLTSVRPYLDETFKGKSHSLILPYEEYTFIYNFVPLYSSDHEVQYAMLVARNITEQVRAERALQATQEIDRDFRDKLRTLHEVSFTLNNKETLDDLLRAGVELGHTHLGFDRIELYLIDSATRTAHGTYGIDPSGAIRDQRLFRQPLAPELEITQALQGEKRIHVWDNGELSDNGVPVGSGWQAMAMVWDGDQCIGYLMTDNLIHQQKRQPYQLELLMLYGSVLGYLIKRKRFEHEIQNYVERLKVLNEIDQSILRAVSPQEIARAVTGRLRKLLLCDYAAVIYGKYEIGQNVLVVDTYSPDDFVLTVQSHIPQGNSWSVYDLLKWDGITPEEQMLVERGVRSYTILALTIDSERVGFLLLGLKAPGRFDEDQINVATIISMQLSVALRQTRMIEQIKSYAGELENLVEERTAQLVAKANELEAFTYSVSHDLRAPLRAMHGFSNALLQNYASDLPEKAHHYLNRIQQNAQRMGILIDDLLELSRVGRREMRRQPVDMTGLVREVLDDLEANHQRGMAKITVHDMPGCNADRALLKQVWFNLISNAIKYSQKREFPIIEIGSTDYNGSSVVYYVRDNGIGFDMQYADKLFGVFQRLHNVEGYEGTGIGLATVHRIIERHGGKVWADAAVDQGATFFFTLTALQINTTEK